MPWWRLIRYHSTGPDAARWIAAQNSGSLMAPLVPIVSTSAHDMTGITPSGSSITPSGFTVEPGGQITQVAMASVSSSTGGALVVGTMVGDVVVIASTRASASTGASVGGVEVEGVSSSLVS